MRTLIRRASVRGLAMVRRGRVGTVENCAETALFGASEMETAELNKGPRGARSGQWPPCPAACHSVKRLAAKRAAAPGTLVIASSAARSGSPPSAKCSR